MENNQLNKLRQLREIYDYARMVCDPIEFAKRQQSLLYSVCSFLIKPLEQYEEDQRNHENE